MSNSNNRVVRKIQIASFTLLASMTLASAPVNAASQCKGLDNAACNAEAACGWVEGYQRKDGKQVSAFCRTKAKPKAKKKQ